MAFLVIGPCSVHIVVESVGGILDFCDGGAKVIDNVVTSNGRISNQIFTTQYMEENKAGMELKGSNTHMMA